MEALKQQNDNPEPKDKNLVTKEDIKTILCLFVTENYTASSTTPEYDYCLKRCTELMRLDYDILEVPNTEGSLCFQYPSTIIIPKTEKTNGKANTTEKSDENNPVYPNQRKTQELFKKSQYARCRQRFPAPVILYQGKYICRSATLASVPEVCYRVGVKDIGFESLYSLKEFLWPNENTVETEETNIKDTCEKKTAAHWQITENFRDKDIELLNYFKVNTIFDLMVEKRKIKHGLFVSSSEKINRDKYRDFKICVAPYPGCEFFKQYHDTMFKAKNLYFNWGHPQCDIELSIPQSPQLNINWESYKNWDLVTMTKNYVTYILQTLQEDSTGILIHCISGWDRTPLFISLVRIILWAEGHIHKSLSALQILYFTIAYDWMLFGHCLQDRLGKSEEIMYFCFGVLKFFTGIHNGKYKGGTNSDADASNNAQSFEDESSEEENDDEDFVMVEPHDNPDYVLITSETDNNSQQETMNDTEDPSHSSWTTVTNWGSIRKQKSKNGNGSSKRDQRLKAVRRHFTDAYFKTVKRDCYGPVKPSPVESVILSMAEFVNSHMPS